jgi:hypothetical protein
LIPLGVVSVVLGALSSLDPQPAASTATTATSPPTIVHRAVRIVIVRAFR